MGFRPYRGKVKKVYLPVTPSTALSANSLVEAASGKLTAADADEVTADVRGVLVKAITSTDSDYASDRRVGILVPVERHVEWLCDATTGTFTAADIGIEYGISDSVTIDQAETTADLFLVTEFVSSTRVIGFLKINGSY